MKAVRTIRECSMHTLECLILDTLACECDARFDPKKQISSTEIVIMTDVEGSIIVNSHQLRYNLILKDGLSGFVIWGLAGLALPFEGIV